MLGLPVSPLFADETIQLHYADADIVARTLRVRVRVRSCLVFSCLVLPWLGLSCLVLSCLALSCLVLSFRVRMRVIGSGLGHMLWLTRSKNK